MNPSCNAALFYFFDSGQVTSVEQLAHFIGGRTRGPRGDDPLPLSQRDEYENIILLCPNCHQIVDKAKEQFPAPVLREWKLRHEDRVIAIFSVPIFSKREVLATEIHTLLRRNKALFDAYGPHSTTGANPIDPRATTWERYVRSDIVPNNRRVLECLLKNSNLLTESEMRVVEDFRLHSEALEYNHLSGDKTADAPLFPLKMNKILGSPKDA
jgi:hypothetical protein